MSPTPDAPFFDFLKLVFAGTPEFAAVTLRALLAAGHQVTLVLTRPDRPAGRGLKARFSAVKQSALDHHLTVLQPATLKDLSTQKVISESRPDAMIVAAYGLMVPPALLGFPPHGCINVHASLLPRWRGAAPIQRALLAGDAVTGISIMRMNEALDTGPILLQQALAIASDDTAGTLHDKLAALGAKLLVQALASNSSPLAQEATAATYAPRIAKGEAEIDWRLPAAAIERQVRAFDPEPGAQTVLDGKVLKIWRARVDHGVAGAPGTVCAAGADGIVVACGDGALRITELQRAGGKRMSARAFVSGIRLVQGICLGIHDD